MRLHFAQRGFLRKISENTGSPLRGNVVSSGQHNQTRVCQKPPGNILTNSYFTPPFHGLVSVLPVTRVKLGVSFFVPAHLVIQKKIIHHRVQFVIPDKLYVQKAVQTALVFPPFPAVSPPLRSHSSYPLCKPVCSPKSGA